jgi:hypothetical protein
MAYNYVTNRDARNFTPGAQVPAVFGFPRTITNVTLHWWGKPEWQQTWEQVMWFFCDNPSVGTSAHEVISDGVVGCIVDHANAAWANGNSRGNAQSITLELNPRMSDGDMNTAAERISDIWKMHGRILPLTEHRDWFATECSGSWDKGEMTRRAMLAYKGVAQEIKKEIKENGGNMSAEQLNRIEQKLDYIIAYSQPGRKGINKDGETASWMRQARRAEAVYDLWTPGEEGVVNRGRLNRDFYAMKAQLEEMSATLATIVNTINSQKENI